MLNLSFSPEERPDVARLFDSQDIEHNFTNFLLSFRPDVSFWQAQGKGREMRPLSHERISTGIVGPACEGEAL